MLEKGMVVFGNWTVEETIGSGAFGTVYKIKREEFGKVFYAAVKVLQIPQDKEEYRRLKSEGMDDASISNYYSQIAQDFVREIEFLSSLDGITNIVDYKDHIIEPNENMGYTIYIKMQMLTPLAKALLDKDGSARFMEADEVVKLGKDMCSALEVCEKRNIIHRDIKIDNIFISENGYYKLGDFGIAKQLEATHGEMSKKGTMLYMAPEVFRGENYDKTVDIYSLGIVLYRLLNKNRAPFFPNYPDPIKFSDKEIANAKRLKGEVLPDIVGIGADLNAVLLKACAFNPHDRYQSVSEFKAALEKVSETPVAPVETAPAVKISSDDEATVGVFNTVPAVKSSSDDEATVGVFNTVPAVKSSSDDEATVGAFSTVPVVNSSSDDEATVGAFGGVPATKRSADDEETVGVFGAIPDAKISSDDEETVGVFGAITHAKISADDEETVGVFGAKPVAEADADDEKTESVFTPAGAPAITSPVSKGAPSEEKKSKAPIIIIIAIILAIGIGVAAFILFGRNSDGNTGNSGASNTTTTTEHIQSTDDDDNTTSTSEVSSVTPSATVPSQAPTNSVTSGYVPTSSYYEDDYYEDDYCEEDDYYEEDYYEDIPENRIYFKDIIGLDIDELTYLYDYCNVENEYEYIYGSGNYDVYEIQSDYLKYDENGDEYILFGESMTRFICINPDVAIVRQFDVFDGGVYVGRFSMWTLINTYGASYYDLMHCEPDESTCFYYGECYWEAVFVGYKDSDGDFYDFYDVNYY